VISFRCCSWLAVALIALGIFPNRIIAQAQQNARSVFDGTKGPTFDSASLEFFEAKIRPLLVARCQRCHGPEKQEASLRLDSRASLLKGGDSDPAIVPHKPGQSLMIDAIHYGDTHQMPPKQQLPADEIALLEEWVRRGGPWPSNEIVNPTVKTGAFDLQKRKLDHWAWKPIVAPAIPKPKDGSRATSAIDAFLLIKLTAPRRAPRCLVVDLLKINRTGCPVTSAGGFGRPLAPCYNAMP
jgi:mono/diheme cytochrome c family protein